MTLGKIANVLGVSVEAIKNFAEDGSVFNIQTLQDHASANQGNFNQCSFSPLDNLMELIDENKKLYECLLASEREKLEILKQQKGS